MKNFIYDYSKKELIFLKELICKKNSINILRVIELKNKGLVSSDNSNVIIWKKNENNKFEIIKEISDFKDAIQHLTLINDKYLICHDNSGILIIYNSLDNFKLEKEYQNINAKYKVHRFGKINCVKILKQILLLLLLSLIILFYLEQIQKENII